MKISVHEINSLLESDVYLTNIESLEKLIQTDVSNTTKLSTLVSKSEITNGKLLALLCLSKPFVDFSIPITKEFIFDTGDVNYYDNYYDNLIDMFTNIYEDPEDIMKLQEGISWGLNRISTFSAENVLLQEGATINLFQIMELAERNPKFKDTLNFTHEVNNKDVDNIQDRINNQNKNRDASIKEIINDDGEFNSLRLLIRSGAGVNTNQLSEVINNIGYKPDMRGKVIQTPIDTSVGKGLRNLDDYLTDSIAARKALTTSKTQVRQSGYLNRKISILTEDCHIVNVKDCGSKHYVQFNIIDQKHLNLIHGRYYSNGESDELHIVRKENSELIGSTIYLRSPITCACKDSGVCHTCYGELWKINNKLNIGTIANLILTDPMTQKLLSSKHLLKVEVKNFNWQPEFEEYFTIFKNFIIPNEQSLRIYVDKRDMSIKDNYSYNKYSMDKFYILGKKDTKLEFTAPVRLILSDENIENIDDFYDDETEVYSFSAEDLDTEHLFKIVIQNVGIADPLLKILDILDTNAYIVDEYAHNYSLVIQEFIKLLIESKTSVQSIHTEVILSCMNFFNFDREELTDKDLKIQFGYNQELMNIKNSIYQSESPVKAFLFERTTKQLKTDSFNNLTAKSGSSKFDDMFIPLSQ